MHSNQKALTGFRDWYEYIFFAVVFFSAYFFLLINKGVFWDSWVLYHQSFEDVFSRFSQAGSPLAAVYNYYVLELFWPQGARLFIAITLLITGLVLNQILIILGMERLLDRVIIVGVFLVAPVNFAKISFINHMSIICVALFFGGFLLFFMQYQAKSVRKYGYRAGALVFFYIAFTVNSLLVFYILLPFAFGYFLYRNDSSYKAILFDFVKHADFWLLPLAFFYIKNHFLAASGIYQGYNTVTFDKALESLKNVHINIYNTIVDMLQLQLSTTQIFLFVLIVICTYFALGLMKQKSEDEEKYELTAVSGIALLVLSFVLLYLAVYPYVVVSQQPTGKAMLFSDWNTRHQLLLPLGLSFACFALIKLSMVAFGKKTGLFVFAVTIAFCIMKSTEVYRSYFIDSIKQEIIIHMISESDVVRNHKSFLIADNTDNTLGRYYRFYEWSGLFKEAFGDQSRFAVDVKQYRGANFYNKFTKMKSYNIPDSPITEPEYVIEINYHGDKDRVLESLVSAYIFNEEESRKLGKELLVVNIRKLS